MLFNCAGFVANGTIVDCDETEWDFSFDLNVKATYRVIRAFLPGTVDSPSLEGRLRATGDYEAARAAFTARQPMGRIASAAEIAALVVYLASDEASYTTGHAHVIDGGWSNI